MPKIVQINTALNCGSHGRIVEQISHVAAERGFETTIGHVDTGFDNICMSDIIEKEEEIMATFQGAFIESGKFEYTDVEGKLLHGNISEDLSNEAIIQLTRTYAGQECRLQIIRRIVNYSNGHKKENVELTGINDLNPTS